MTAQKGGLLQKHDQQSTMMFRSFVAALALLCVPGVSGFVHPRPMDTRSTTSLEMKNQQSLTTAAASFAAAVFLMGSAMDVSPAFAMDDVHSDFGGSSQVLAARSGGRAGGRSAGARRAPSRPAPTRTNTRVIERTTYVAPPIYSSPMYVAPYYNPLPGLGFGMGLNAINQVGNDMRDYRQETEIQSTRAQLEQSKMREAEMEARLRQLEMQQGQNQMSQQQIQQMMMMQQQAAAAAK